MKWHRALTIHPLGFLFFSCLTLYLLVRPGVINLSPTSETTVSATVYSTTGSVLWTDSKTGDTCYAGIVAVKNQ